MNTNIPIACAFALIACEQAEVQETDSAEQSFRAADTAAPDEGELCEEPSSTAAFTPSGRDLGADEHVSRQPLGSRLACDASSASGTIRSITLADVVILREAADPMTARSGVGSMAWRPTNPQARRATQQLAAE